MTATTAYGAPTARDEPMPSVADLCTASANFLREVARVDGLFPYSSRVSGRTYVNDFEHRAAVRYTINSLLGLQAAALHGAGDVDRFEVEKLLSTFLRCYRHQIVSPADLGLMLVLLGEGAEPSRDLREMTGRVRAGFNSSRMDRLTMQDLSWMLWGACTAARAGVGTATDLATALGEVVLTRFVHPQSGFPRHDLSPYRRDIVSFGAVTYFLRALFELQRLTDDERARQRFAGGVNALLELQGELGEWPWLMSVQSRIRLDSYPVFAVHQDSMSMLFLLPALDDGLPVADAVAKSFAWTFGRNELETPMITFDPFVAHRSIERKERLPRARRYLRSVPRSVSRRHDGWANGQGLRINRECRSYHVGWILYVWAGRPALPPWPGPLELPDSVHQEAERRA